LILPSQMTLLQALYCCYKLKLLQAPYCYYKLKNVMVTVEVPSSLHIEELNEGNWHVENKFFVKN